MHPAPILHKLLPGDRACKLALISDISEFSLKCTIGGFAIEPIAGTKFNLTLGDINMIERAPEFLMARSTNSDSVAHILTVYPATAFEYRFQSSAGSNRVFHLERGALESSGIDSVEVSSFRAGVSPIENPTRGGFFTSPDSILLTAHAHITIDGSVSGDSIVCRSLGSWDGLKITLKIFRENPDRGIGLVLQEDIQDSDEHTFILL